MCVWATVTCTANILDTYAVLAYSGITSASVLNVSSGSYGSAPTASYTGVINGQVNSEDAAAAQASLASLVSAINGLPNSAPTPTLVNNTFTATPGVYQFAGSTVAGVHLVFSGGPGDQFYIVSSSFITLDGILSISLAGGVQAKNIFWLANSAFSMTGASPPAIFGTIIAKTTASFANGLVVHGRVFAQTGAVTFGGTPAVVEGLVNACAPLG